ncbi:hypothetical protein [Nocardioides dongkuii]|uniref:hypothetical protein n=1 Tax=Nocardioides dongkuii TaxID=2760089 RepID=UPI001878019F|nr:hypothetical protein [Nocardioides dongkuii]
MKEIVSPIVACSVAALPASSIEVVRVIADLGVANRPPPSSAPSWSMTSIVADSCAVDPDDHIPGTAQL